MTPATRDILQPVYDGYTEAGARMRDVIADVLHEHGVRAMPRTGTVLPTDDGALYVRLTFKAPAGLDPDAVVDDLEEMLGYTILVDVDLDSTDPAQIVVTLPLPNVVS